MADASIRPLCRADREALAPLLAAAPAMVGRDLWCVAASGGAEHLWGAWEGERLVSAARLVPNRRARNSHVGVLDVVGEAHAAALLGVAVDLVDRWTSLDRVELSWPADHPDLAAARTLGFEVDVTQRRAVDGPPTLVLGRLRPGFSPRPLRGPPPWPPRGRRAQVAWGWRRMEEADVPEVAAFSVEATAIWGTLQTPSSSLDFYLDRHRASGDDNLLLALTADGAVAGIGGLHPTAHADVRVLGMAVAAEWQGCGGGLFLMHALLTEARQLGVRRLELAVWEDNTRARALYEAVGFRVEGVRRCDGVRDGGHASSTEMALDLGSGA